MYRLTERRLQKAANILEKYRDQLHTRFHFDARQFEMELRECWGTGYRGIKSVVKDMLKNDRYRHVAVYYMEHANAPVVVSEFKLPLAKVYGIRRYDSAETEQKRNEFWANFREKVAPQAD